MKIRELNIQEFKEYVESNPLKNYMQTEEYARIMGENGYNYDYIGLINDNGKIVAASLILFKKIGFNQRYGYAPKGFLINYYDEALVREFIERLKEYYAKKNIVFIKINPEIVVSEVNPKTFELKENPNVNLKQSLQRYDFVKLKDNLYFESLVPRFNAYIDLKNSRLENYSKANRNKVRNADRKGLYLFKGEGADIEEFFKMTNSNKTLEYYNSFYRIFNQTGKVELILVKVDYERYIKNCQELYDRELNINSLLNEIIHRSHKMSDLNRKMASDSRLTIIKNEIIEATEGLRDNNNRVVAGALVLKYDNRVHVIASGFDRKFSHLNANYFLHDKLIERYKDDFEYLDIGAVSGDFKKTSPYHGLNRFKLGFNPHIYENIGEFDLVLNRMNYDYLLSIGKLTNEFKKDKKKKKKTANKK